jgi:hypothetical protein
MEGGGADRMAQIMKHLPSKHKALSSNPMAIRKKIKKERKENGKTHRELETDWKEEVTFSKSQFFLLVVLELELKTLYLLVRCSVP